MWKLASIAQSGAIRVSLGSSKGKMTENNTIYLVDGSSLAFRSFFALIRTGMRSTQGVPTWAVYGFFSSLFDLIDKRQPHSMAVCFDLAGPTFRHEAFEEYKANRQEMPDDLAQQWPLIKDGVQKLALPLYEMPGWEADDIIGTVAKRAEEKNLKVVILTGDQDAFQLLDDNIQVLMPTKEGLKTFGRQEVFDKLGVWPEQIVDYKALCGDSSDNIPGVKGIGEKTAVQLLGQYQTLDGVYAHLDEIKSASQRKKLEEGKSSAYASQDLARIRLDVPLDFDFEHCRLSMPSVAELSQYFQDLDFKNIVRRLPKVLSRFSDEGNGVSPGQVKLELAEGLKLKSIEKPTAAPLVIANTKRISAACELEAALNLLNADTLVAVSVCSTSSGVFEEAACGLAFSFCPDLKWDADLKRVAGFLQGEPLSFFVALTDFLPGTVEHGKIMNGLKGLLEGAQPKVCFDAKRVSSALSMLDFELSGLIFDPVLASYILNPDESHKFSALSLRYLGAEFAGLGERGAKTKKSQVSLLGSTEIYEHAGLEAACVLKITEKMATPTLFEDDQVDLLYEMDLPLSLVLARMEANGVSLDRDYFKSLETELKSILAQLEKEIHQFAGHAFNINSPLQLQKVLFDELKLPAKTKTKSGFSTDAAVLESLLGEHPIVAKLLEFRQLSKLDSTYVEALPRQLSSRDGKLHGEFHQTVTATGRLSSSNPNLQNIPIRSEIGRRIRGGFVPADPANFLMSADYSQIELRLLAHMSGDENLIEAFRQEEDIHERTAKLIFDLKDEPVSDEHRRIGKTLNFALIYQQGAFSTGQSLGISTKEAQGFIEKYFASFPKVRGFMNRVLEEARERGYVQTLWGRRRYFLHLNDRNDNTRRAEERAAFNAPLQGSAADLMKLAMIRLDGELKARALKSELILQVHDELVLDVKAEELEPVREVLLASMQMDQPLLVPLKVDLGVGKNWMDAK